jgi:hypothetical protein
MKAWVEKNINPVGLEKKDRGSLYSLIARVFGRVRDDAHTAVKAHFPFLANEEKLREHGKALYIPHITGDTPEEYRRRVSTASFFLSRAGERSYILEQMETHFGGRFTLKEEFLQVLVKITGLTDDDRRWVLDFLDSILDPNIALTVAEWFHFVEYLVLQEEQRYTLWKSDTDMFRYGLCHDRRFLCDQGKATLCNGDLVCDGSWNCEDFIPARGTIFDTVLAPVFPNGAYRCDGSFDCSGYIPIYDPGDFPGPIFPADVLADTLVMQMGTERFEDVIRLNPICDGAWTCDGSNLAPMADAPMAIRVIRPMRCDGSRTPSCSVCDGSWRCDGTYARFDGWYCSGDLQEEEVVL